MPKASRRLTSLLVLLTVASCAGGSGGAAQTTTRTDAHEATAATTSNDGCSYLDAAVFGQVLGQVVTFGPIERSEVTTGVGEQDLCPIHRPDGRSLGIVVVFWLPDATTARAKFNDDIARPEKCDDGTPSTATKIDVADDAIIYQCGISAYALSGDHAVYIGLNFVLVTIAPTADNMKRLLASAVASPPIG